MILVQALKFQSSRWPIGGKSCNHEENLQRELKLQIDVKKSLQHQPRPHGGERQGIMMCADVIMLLRGTTGLEAHFGPGGMQSFPYRSELQKS